MIWDSINGNGSISRRPKRTTLSRKAVLTSRTGYGDASHPSSCRRPDLVIETGVRFGPHRRAATRAVGSFGLEQPVYAAEYRPPSHGVDLANLTLRRQKASHRAALWALPDPANMAYSASESLGLSAVRRVVFTLCTLRGPGTTSPAVVTDALSWLGPSFVRPGARAQPSDQPAGGTMLLISV